VPEEGEFEDEMPFRQHRHNKPNTADNNTFNKLSTAEQKE
jgi:hypothetical protein